MSEAVSDRQLVLALRAFVRAAAPLLDAMREANLLGLRDRPLYRVPGMPRRRGDRFLDWLARRRMPGTARWAMLGPDERTRWWMNRFGVLTALLAAVPGLGGALADRLPVQDALGAAGQGVLLCAIAGEYGVTGEDDRVALLAEVLFGRRLDVAGAAGREQTGTEPNGAETDRQAAELTTELAESRRKTGRVTVAAIAGTLWRLGRLLWSIPGELEKRPRGRFYHRLLGMLPVVGMFADYLGERSALRRVRRRGVRLLTAGRMPQPVR